MSRTRDIADILSSTEVLNTSNNALLNTSSEVGLDSAQVSAIANAAGLTVYATKENLPTSGLTSGDQAYVTDTSRMYISNGSGWYNVALINATPSLVVSPSGTITLATDGASPTVITLTATDSDNSNANLVLSVDSGGDFYKIATLSQDSSVFTITPRTADSATALGYDGSATLTFKASDGISFGSHITTFNLTFTVPNSQYTNFFVKADTAGTDNQVDASTSTHTITETGNVTSTALTPYHPGGYSTYFDGTGDYLSTASNSVFDLAGSIAWTIEGWFYWSSLTGEQTLVEKFTGGNGPGWTLYKLNSSNAIGFFSGSSATFSNSIGTVTSGQWHHVAITRDEAGTTRGFLDGTLNATGTYSIGNNSTGNLYIGARNGSSNYMNGYVRDVRIVKGTALYTSSFTPPNEQLTAITNTSLLACHLPYIADGSSNDHAITVAGNTSTKRFAPYDYLGYAKATHGGSVYFDGTGDYLTTPTNADFAYGTGDFTIEAWVNIPSAPSNYKYILGQATVSTGLGLYIQSGVYKLYGGGNLIVQSSVGYTLNVWQHIAIARSGTTLKMFLNGAEVGSATNSLNAASGSSNGLTIGRWLEAPDTQTWLGYIADVRVVKGTALYTSAFTAPTQPLTAISGTSLLTCTNTNDIWDAGTGKALTKFGNATVSNTYRRFTTSSAISFDGSGDYVGWDENGTYFYGSNDQTIEMWVYPNANSNYQTLFSMNRGTSTGFNFGIDGSSRPFLWKGNFRIQAGTVSNTTWSHVALVRYNGVWSIYVNGTSVGATWSDTTTYTGQDFAIGDTVASGGGATGEWFNGYMQNVRVTKGLARYTTNFTPQTSEFDG